MAKRLLIDGTIPQETRIALLDGNTLADFDIEFSDARPLRSNIYLAKVVRVEPSLQAAFVEYGGNRQGFLPFGEIHPDYFRIPTSDREELLAEEAEEREEDSEASDDERESDAEDSNGLEDSNELEARGADESEAGLEADLEESAEDLEAESDGAGLDAEADGEGLEPNGEDQDEDSAHAGPVRRMSRNREQTRGQAQTRGQRGYRGRNGSGRNGSRATDRRQTRRRARHRYKIQEVIQRNQVMLVQVIKDERPGKGAAVTTYISLAGRYCVLMPNSDHGGGVSRKVSSAAQRDKLRKIIEHLEVPEKMAVILRTAGSERTRTEIRRDYESLLNLWEDIRARTLESAAPCLIHEEGSLIRRALRDLYTGDEEEIIVEGEKAWQEARDAMKAMMPSHVRRVRQWDAPQSLFARHQVEKSLSGVHQPKVRLRSGGEIVIAQTEALVAIDVNSGRSTRERHIESTAFKTNLEAAREVARQLKIRDLAGLVVVDFIDMDSGSHIREVERTLRDALQNDRARVQVGRISQFGLLELSRQRLRASLVESSTVTCSACDGTGRMSAPSADGAAVLRQLMERLRRRKGAAYGLRVAPNVAEYLLNKRRSLLLDLEKEHGIAITIIADPAVPTGGEVRIEIQNERNGRRGVRGRGAEDGQDGLEEADEEASEGEELNGRGSSRRSRRGGRSDGRHRARGRRARDDRQGADESDSYSDSRTDSYSDSRADSDADSGADSDYEDDATDSYSDGIASSDTSSDGTGSDGTGSDSTGDDFTDDSPASADDTPSKRGSGRGAVRKTRKAVTKTGAKAKVAKRKTARKSASDGASKSAGDTEDTDKKKSASSSRLAKTTSKATETSKEESKETSSKSSDGSEDTSDKPKRKGWWS